MKKLSIIIAAGTLALATPVFACPGHDDSAAPKTAEKAPAKDTKGTTEKAPAKDAKAPAKDTSTAKAPAPAPTKKPDKVSQK